MAKQTNKQTNRNNKGLYRYTGQKRQDKESVPPLINEKEEPATTGMEKAEILNEFFASAFTGSQDSHVFHILKPHTAELLGGREMGEKNTPHCKSRASPITFCKTKCVYVNGGR